MPGRSVCDAREFVCRCRRADDASIARFICSQSVFYFFIRNVVVIVAGIVVGVVVVVCHGCLCLLVRERGNQLL